MFNALCLCLVASATFQLSSTTVKMSSGIHSNKQPHMVPFETIIPVNFLIPLPSPPPSSPPPTCDGIAELNQVCYLAKSLHAAYLKLSTTFGKYFPYGNFDTSKVSRSILPFLGGGMKWLYGTATEDDINYLHGNLSVVEQHQQQIKEQVSADHKTLLDLTRNINNYAKDLSLYLNNVTDTIKTSFASKMSVKSKQLEIMLAYSIHHNFLVNYIDHFHGILFSAGSDCREGYIPVALLPRAALETKIQDVVRLSLLDGYTAAAPVSTLINLQIAACKFTEKDLTVRVNIPMVRANVEYSVINIVTIPFQHHDKLCEYEIPKLVGIRGDDYIPLKDILPESKLIHIPPFPDVEGHTSDCIRRLMNPKNADQLSNCPMQCSTARGPVIRQLELGKFIISNVEKVIISCKNENKTFTLTNDEKIGYLKFEMPCKCDGTIVSERGNQTIFPPFPCRASAVDQTATLVPLAWTKLRTMDFNNGTLSLANATEIFDPGWLAHVPTIHVEEPKLVPQWNTPIAYLQWASNPDYIWFWNTFLTVCVLVLLVKNFWGCTSLGYMSVPTMLFSKANGARAESGSFLTLMYSLEWTTIVGTIICVVLVLMIFVLVYRILRVVRRTSRFLENNLLLRDVEEEPRSRTNRRY